MVTTIWDTVQHTTIKVKDINMLFFTTVPFSMNLSEQRAWFYHGGGLELLNEALAKYNMDRFFRW